MRKRYVAKSIPFKSGAVACSSEVVGVAESDPSDPSQGPAIRFSLEGGGERGGGKICLWRTRPRRTNGEEIPLKSPWRRSSRAMVASAWKVDRYRRAAFGDGFWNLYFTFGDSWVLYDNNTTTTAALHAVSLTHRYRKEIRRLDLRCRRRCQRENRPLGQECLKPIFNYGQLVTAGGRCCLARPTWTSSQSVEAEAVQLAGPVTDRRRR